MRKLTLFLMLSALISSACAQFFVGLPVSTLISTEGVVGTTGLQIGTYELADNFGIRGNVETSLAFDGSLVQSSFDAFYTTGGGTVFYTGGGLGYLAATVDALGSGGLLYVDALIGVDFDTESTISLFLEINPRVALGGGAFVRIGSGVNFHIDEKRNSFSIIP